MKTKTLTKVLAQACHYAQDHIDHLSDPEHEAERTKQLECVGHMLSCFIAQNTPQGCEGVSSDTLLDDLIAHPMKSTDEWEVIIDRVVQEYGGWKKKEPKP